MTAASEDNLFPVIIKGSSILLLILAVTGLIFFSTNVALGILAGGIIALVNFFWLRNLLQRILGQLPPNAGRYAFIRYIGRMTVTACALYYIMTSHHFSLAGLMTGLSIIVINIVALSLYRALRTGG